MDLDDITLKGEFVIILSASEKKEDKSIEDYKDEILKMKELGKGTKDIVKKIQKESNISKNEIYAYVLKV